MSTPEDAGRVPSLAGRLLRMPLRLLPSTARVPILRGAARGRLWIVGSGTHGCWLGTYEAAKRRAFEAAIRPGDVVYDVGAHAGYYTLSAAARVGPEGRVVAFEPAPGNLVLLREHLRLNAVANVQVVEAAVSDRAGTARLAAAGSGYLARLDDAGGLVVQTVALDAERTLPPPDVVKIDVEGHELAVLNGARALLREARPAVFLAVHGPELEAACRDALRTLGYAVRALESRGRVVPGELIAVSR